MAQKRRSAKRRDASAEEQLLGYLESEEVRGLRRGASKAEITLALQIPKGAVSFSLDSLIRKHLVFENPLGTFSAGSSQRRR